jgi:hypothetical protein
MEFDLDLIFPIKDVTSADLMTLKRLDVCGTPESSMIGSRSLSNTERHGFWS